MKCLKRNQIDLAIYYELVKRMHEYLKNFLTTDRIAENILNVIF